MNTVGWHTNYKVTDGEPTKDELVEQLLKNVNEYCLFYAPQTLDRIQNIISKIKKVEEGHI